jgi:hypothetical protein
MNVILYIITIRMNVVDNLNSVTERNNTGFMLIVQYTTFMMSRFHGSMPVRLWLSSRKSKGI